MTKTDSQDSPRISEKDVNDVLGQGEMKSRDYHENHRKLLENTAIQQLIEHKKEYSKKAYCVVIAWLVFIVGVVILNAISKFLFIRWPHFFSVTFSLFSDNVLIVLIGSTTISVLGLFAIILKGTFTSKLIEDLAAKNSIPLI